VVEDDFLNLNEDLDMEQSINIADCAILVVEDDKTSQAGIEKFLHRYCKDVYLASNGEEGLEIFLDKRPKIVISDIRMPKMDGIAMSRKIREISKSVKIIIVTAYEEIDYLHGALDANINKFLKKPLKKEKLFNALLELSTEISTEERTKEIEQMLYQESILASKGELLKEISHHWRQPLSVISMTIEYLIEMIEENRVDKDEMKANLDRCLGSVYGLSEKLNNFSMIFDNTQICEKFSLKRAISDILFLKEEYKIGSVEFVENIDELDDVRVYGKPNELVQAITNIIKNSYEFAIQRAIEKPKIWFSVLLFEDKFVKIIVKDNCLGVSEDIKHKIFDPYFSTKKELNGTGLGLYLTKNIIEKNFKGTITAENCDNGLQITIILPLDKKS